MSFPIKDMHTPNIAIFVSHRIDLLCESPNNPIYHPIRCGAVFDKSDSSLPGDNVGENISAKRLSFNELTVQYWAWKNYDADYYGLCHYRRYFSFADEIFETKRFNVIEKEIIPNVEAKYSLNDMLKIERVVEEYDVITPYAFDIRTILGGVPGGRRYYPHTVREFWDSKSDQIDSKCIDILIDIVRERHPKMYPYLLEYLEGTHFYGGCTYIMKKELFNEMCIFQFDVLFSLEANYDMSHYVGEKIRQPGLMGEILYGAFLLYLKKSGFKIKELQVVFFSAYKVETPPPSEKSLSTNIATTTDTRDSLYKRIRDFLKKICTHFFPAYRVATRVEQKIDNYYNGRSLIKTASKPVATSLTKSKWDSWTLTSNINLHIVCLAQEIHETHKASFAEFRNCHIGEDVALVATGPSMKYYTQIPCIPHIGVNAAFKSPNIKLDYYFTTDFESKNEWFFELKNYDFVKFFGQYSTGVYRDRFQVSENLILENHARRFFQGAPNEDIAIDIQFYPLMGFYSIAFQALHFAIYTNPRRIFLIGCDCSSEGYFDGSAQLFANPPKWFKGYQKFKKFVERFYPETEIISVNPIGLRGVFRDVYTADFLADHPEIDASQCNLLTDIIDEES